jgi:hypothetical protein
LTRKNKDGSKAVVEKALQDFPENEKLRETMKKILS